MNELGIIKILHKHRLRLLVFALAVGVLTALVTLFIPNKYSASAAISVQRPEMTLTGENPPLSVETLRSLVESTRVKWDLFQELIKKGIIEKDRDFRRFQKSLSTSVKRDQSRERLPLPIVTLTVTTADPELSMAVANLWAAAVLRKTREIYQSGVDELGSFTAGIYEKVNKSLLESEEEYTATRLESNLTVNKLLLGKNQELYSRISQEVLSLKEVVATRRAVLEQLKTSLSGQEIEGSWAGEVFSRKLADDPEYIPPESGDLAGRIARTIRSLRANEKALAEFEETSRLNDKYILLKIRKQQIEDLSGEILTARTELSTREPTLAKLREELAKLDEKIVMSKAIGDDKLWETYLESGAKKLSELPMMRTESPNPVFEETQKEMVRLSAEITGLKNKVAAGQMELENIRAEVLKLNREISPLEARRKDLQNAVNKDRELLAYYEQSYKEDRQKLESGEKELAGMEAELTAKRAQLDELRREIARLEKIVLSGETRLGRQQREIENLSEVRSSLAARAEEVELLRVTMEDVSRSGTVLLFQAQADPLKVGPSRTRIVLIAMMLGIITGALYLILGELIREG